MNVDLSPLSYRNNWDMNTNQSTNLPKQVEIIQPNSKNYWYPDRFLVKNKYTSTFQLIHPQDHRLFGLKHYMTLGPGIIRVINPNNVKDNYDLVPCYVKKPRNIVESEIRKAKLLNSTKKISIYFQTLNGNHFVNLFTPEALSAQPDLLIPVYQKSKKKPFIKIGKATKSLLSRSLTPGWQSPSTAETSSSSNELLKYSSSHIPLKVKSSFARKKTKKNKLLTLKRSRTFTKNLHCLEKGQLHCLERQRERKYKESSTSKPNLRP